MPETNGKVTQRELYELVDRKFNILEGKIDRMESKVDRIYGVGTAVAAMFGVAGAFIKDLFVQK